MKYIDILNTTQKELKKYKIPNPFLDCEILLSKVLNVKNFANQKNYLRNYMHPLFRNNY